MHKINVYQLVIGLMSVFTLPYGVHAALVSSQYTLTGYGFGGTENVTFSSPQFTLTKIDNGSGVHSSAVDPVSPSDTSGGSHGSRKSIVEGVLSGTSSVVLRGGQISSAIVPQNNRGVGFFGLFERDDEESTDESEIRADESVADSERNVPRADGRNQRASVIGAYIEGQYFWIREALSDLFDHRSARVGVLVGVLGGLLYTRSYTRVGRKYRPF